MSSARFSRAGAAPADVPADDVTEMWFAEVLVRARQGDGSAFDELVRWLERPLLGFIRARGVGDVDDVANEVLLRVFRGIDGFEGNAAQFRAWTFQITRHLIIDQHRQARRRDHVVLTPGGEVPECAEVDALVDVEQADRIEALLSVLTADQREVLLLRVVAGLSVDETAAVLGKRPGAVRALQHRALGSLRGSFSRLA